MAYLQLRDLRDQRLLEFDRAEVRLGRDPKLEIVVTGPGSEVVSGTHVRLTHRQSSWWVEDLGGRNGTFVDGQRVPPNNPLGLAAGQVVALGSRGVRYKVVAVVEAGAPDATILELPYAGPSDETLPMDLVLPGAAPVAPPPPTEPSPAVPSPPPLPPAPPAVHVLLRDVRSAGVLEARGGRLRIGRGRECELRPVEAGDTSVSRVHAEIVLRPDGSVVLRDARSRNGTYLNGEAITTDRPLRPGDRVRLGEVGPELVLEGLEGTGQPVVPATAASAASPAPVPRSPPRPAPPAPPAPPPVAAQQAAPSSAAPRRSFGGQGRTLFIRDLIHQTNRKSAARLRWIVWSFAAVIALGFGGLYWWSEHRVRSTEVELASQREALIAARAAADSVRSAAMAEYQRLSAELTRAREGSAPRVVLDSLRSALSAAEARTSALEAALARAQASVTAQLAAGDSLRAEAEAEIERLRARIAAGGGNVSRELVDSLRRAMEDAERRAAELEASVRAVRGTDLARVAQANQGAVGLVSTFTGADIYDGSGFVVSPSGYFITNRHVVRPEGHEPDSVFVTMADQRTMSRADVVGVFPQSGHDLAVLRIRRYQGPHVPGVDWTGDRARQGEPAALIGFPAGVAAALDQTRTVRTSMSAGIFSKVTPELIQFDGFTVGGSSGSPVFNAQGEVVAVHAQGLREAAGLGFTIPVRLVMPLFPAEVRRELGL